MMILQLALKNLLMQKKRYALMATAVAIGFFLMTILSALSEGALNTIRLKSARYFSGQLCVYGLNGITREVDNPDFVVDTLQKARLSVETISKRSILYDDSDAKLFFNGSYVLVRKVIGVDFDTERQQLETLPFIDGGIGNGILISRAITDDIGARVGDSITFSANTKSGQVNTITVPIAGIFDEINLFGYSVYMDRTLVNTLAMLPKEYVSEIAVYTKDGASVRRIEETIRTIFENDITVLPHISNRSEFTKALTSVPAGEKALAIVSIDAQLEEVTLLLTAFEICTYFVLIVFMIITAVGIINTYRVILYNRTGEIGTMRALGIQKRTILYLFLLEALLLSIFSVIAGFISSLLALQFTHVFTLSANPAVSMFTEFNKLQYSINIGSFSINVLLIIFSVLLAVWAPSKKAATISPAEALRKL